MKSLNVLNTRPLHQAETLNKMISECGGTPFSLPTLDIIPVDVEPPDLNNFDIAIFVSANAVLYGLKEAPNIPVIAVGPGTAKTLKKKCVSDVIIPEQYNSEGILALPELQNIQNKKIAIVCGENPRPLLNETLKKRSADVSLIACYRRVRPNLDDKSKQMFSENKIDIIISTSKESLKNLYEMFGNTAQQKLLETPVLVISPGMQVLAETLGWTRVIRSSNATDEAIIEIVSKFD